MDQVVQELIREKTPEQYQEELARLIKEVDTDEFYDIIDKIDLLAIATSPLVWDAIIEYRPWYTTDRLKTNGCPNFEEYYYSKFPTTPEIIRERLFKYLLRKLREPSTKLPRDLEPYLHSYTLYDLFQS